MMVGQAKKSGVKKRAKPVSKPVVKREGEREKRTS